MPVYFYVIFIINALFNLFKYSLCFLNLDIRRCFVQSYRPIGQLDTRRMRATKKKKKKEVWLILKDMLRPVEVET